MRTQFNFRKRIEIRMRRNQQGIVDTIAQEIQTSHADAVIRTYSKFTDKLKSNQSDLKVLIAKGTEFLKGKHTIWGTDQKYSLPILTPTEVAAYKTSYWTFIFMLILLFGFDTYFATMIIPFIIGSQSLLLQVFLGGCVAILIISICEVGMHNLASYFEGRELLETGQLQKSEAHKVQNKLRLAIILIIIGVAATVCIAMVRFVFLENVQIAPGNGSSLLAALDEKLIKGSKYASACTFLLAFIVILLFGIFSSRKAKYANKYKVFKKYCRNAAKIEQLNKQAEGFNNSLQAFIRETTEASWSLMLHGHKLLKKNIDAQNVKKLEDYYAASEKPGFAITKEIFAIYKKCFCAVRELFIFSISETKEILELKLEWTVLLTDIRTMVKNYHAVHHYDNSATQRGFVGGMRYATVILAVMCCSLMLSSCSNQPKSINLITFVDLSASTRPEVKAAYLAFVRSSIDKLTPGSTLRVLPIDGATEKGSRELISITIPDAAQFANEMDPPSQKNEIEKIRFNSFKDSVVKMVDKEISVILMGNGNRRDTRETDVLGAFRLLNKYIADTSRKDIENMGLFLSDMLSCNTELDLERRKLNMEQQSVALEKINKIDLSKWHIAVLTGESDISAEKYRSTKDFWLTFLHRNNNKMPVYESGAQSLVYAMIEALKKPEQSKYSWITKYLG